MRFFAVLAILALAGSCARRAPIVKSPYQQSVEAYYRDLDATGAGGNFAATEQSLNDALAAAPGDMEARALRANVYMLRWTVGNDPTARAKLIRDLKTLHYGAQASSSVDWVRPRVLIIVGDLLSRSGVSLAAGGRIHEAKGNFQEASRYYAAAFAIAGGASNPSPGMSQEKTNAFNGYVQAQRGVADTLTRIRQEENLVEKLMGRTLISLANTLRDGAVPATPDTTLGLDIEQLKAAQRTFQDLANREQNAVIDWCKANPGAPASNASGLEALVKAIDLRERQHGKELVVSLLTEEASSATADLDFLYKGLVEFCK